MKILKFINERPSAWIPVVMSLAALALVFGYILFIGIPKVPVEDENLAARIFQLLLVGQIPVIIYFTVKYIMRKPKEVFLTLLIQFLAGFLAFVSVFILEM